MAEAKGENKHIRENDAKVVEFLKYLGVDLDNTLRVIITVETGHFVRVEETRHPVKRE